MNIQLEPLEARVIGCLIEKQITTPDQYPLSLNALTLACNQKSNRDPLMSVSDATVQSTLDALSKKHLVMEKSGFGSRVPKYQHRFCNTEYGTLKFSPQELAVLCELMLRGPQTPGELRSRASRMAPFADVAEIENALTQLVHRSDGPFAMRLAREPGRRDSRYAQLFTGETHVAATEADDVAAEQQVASSSSGGGSRLDKLEAEVRQLRQEMDALKKQPGGP